MSVLRHLLSVEDDPDLRLLLQLALETVGGFALTLCESGEQALQIARSRRPDLILLDVNLPGLDGPATLAALRADPATAAIPVVFMTGHCNAAEQASLQAQGALEVICKPFDPLALAGQVAAIWARRDG
jgi:CheY-like chemotaxis protein